MGRSKNLLNYALNCIQRYKLRTIVILICLVVASSTFSAVAFLSDGLVKEGALSLKYAPDLTVQGIQAGRQTLIPTNYVNYILGVAPGIAGVSERIWGYGNVGNTLIVIVGIDVNNSATLNQTRPQLGSIITASQRHSPQLSSHRVVSQLPLLRHQLAAPPRP